MATNHHQPGKVISVSSSGVIASGAPVMVGVMPGVALNAASGSGQPLEVALEGVFRDLPKTTGITLTQGERVYLDAVTGITDDAESGANPAFGWAWEAAGSGATTAIVKIG